MPEQRELRLAPLLGLFFVLFLAPLFFTSLSRDIFVLPKALVLAVGVALIWIDSLGEGALPEKSLSRAITLFGGAAALSALFAADYPMAILGPHQNQFYALAPLALCALAYHGAANSENASVNMAVRCAVFGGVAVSLLALFPPTPWFKQLANVGPRVGSTLGAPIYLGSYLALVIPLLWDSYDGHVDALMLAYLIAVLLASGARGSLIGAGCGILLVDILRGRGKRAAIMAVAAILGVAVVFKLRHTGASSDAARMEIFGIAIRSWRDHPLLGWGPDCFSLAFRRHMTLGLIKAAESDKWVFLSAHNDLLQVLATMGLIGLFAYLTLIKDAVILLARSVVTGDEFSIPVAGAALAVFVNAKFNPIPLTVMVMLAVLLGLLDRRAQFIAYVDRPRAVAGFAASALLVGLYGVSVMAEVHARRGDNLMQTGHFVAGAEEFNQAARINPFDIWFPQRQLDALWTVAPLINADRAKLAAFSHDIAEGVARLHPEDATAHEVRALSHQFEGAMIGESRAWEAAHEMQVAVQIEPNRSAYRKRFDALSELYQSEHKRRK